MAVKTEMHFMKVMELGREKQSTAFFTRFHSPRGHEGLRPTLRFKKFKMLWGFRSAS